VPDAPGLPSAEELAALPHEELAARLAEAYRLISELSARVERLEKRLARDSASSSRPPSSDDPYKKKPRDRSLREKGKRAPGKQPGEPGSTMRLVDNPKHRYWYPPAECAKCGTGLEGQEVFAQRRHQVTDIKPPPEPEITGHVAQSKRCPCCGEVTEGPLPPGVRARVVRAGGSCAGRELDLRELRSGRSGGGADGGDGRGRGVAGLDRRGAGEGRRAGGVQRVHGPRGRPAAAGGGGARGRDPGPRGGRDAVRAPGLHPVADAHARRGPVRGRGRRRRRAARLPGHSRPRRLPPGLRSPHRRAPCLVRCSSPAGPEGPVRVRAARAGLGQPDGRPAHRGSRRRPRCPCRRQEGP